VIYPGRSSLRLFADLLRGTHSQFQVISLSRDPGADLPWWPLFPGLHSLELPPLPFPLALASSGIGTLPASLSLLAGRTCQTYTVSTDAAGAVFKGLFYDQTDWLPWVPPPPPLSPVLSNFFTGHHEKIWLNNYLSSDVLFYRRYVDDNFCLFRTENDALLFFDYIITRHPNIRFTMERQVEKKLPLLDIC